MIASSMLDAVEQWAFPDYWLMRETAATVNGRLDGLLVPRSFKASIMRRSARCWTDKLAVVGVEVKASRADFQRGLREGQFERYAGNDGGYENGSAGLFVVTGRDVKSSEVPAACGHVVCFQDARGYSGISAVCRRLPHWRDVTLDADTAWRIVFYGVQRNTEERREMEQRQRAKMNHVGALFAHALGSIVDKERPNAQ